MIMRTTNRTLTMLGAVAAIGLAAGAAGFWYGASSANAAAAQALPASPASTSPQSYARQSYAPVVERVVPAVVTIRSAHRVRAAQQFPFFDDPFFRQFFGDGARNRSPRDRSLMQQALGSGVIVSADGYILTNHHVIDGAEQISVDLSDRRSFEAKVIGTDAPSDLALLKVDATGLPVLPLGDSDKVRVGDLCLAVGYPLGIGETVTAGIISARGRATGLSDGSFEDFLQTDAPINQGNSGGALVNAEGELIGINSQIISPSGGNIGIGFAIPSNMARNAMEQLKDGGKVRRGKLGAGIQEITSDLARSLDLPEVRGVLVNAVDAGGPADKAGIKAGDVITAVNGAAVDSANALRNRIAGTRPGTDITISLLRKNKQQQVHARLAELATDKDSPASSEKPGGQREQLGVTVEPLTSEWASQLGLDRTVKGLVVTDVDPASPAAEAGIQEEDVIAEVNQQAVRSASDLRSALRRSDSRPALLLVHRDGRSLFLAVPLR
jgi:serine protease Do